MPIRRALGRLRARGPNRTEPLLAPSAKQFLSDLGPENPYVSIMLLSAILGVRAVHFRTFCYLMASYWSHFTLHRRQ